MDERAVKQLKVTESLLRNAAAELPSHQALAQFERLMSNSEFALALSELSALGEAHTVTAQYWWWLKKAAQVMGLAHERNTFMRRYQVARASK